LRHGIVTTRRADRHNGHPWLSAPDPVPTVMADCLLPNATNPGSPNQGEESPGFCRLGKIRRRFRGRRRKSVAGRQYVMPPFNLARIDATDAAFLK